MRHFIVTLFLVAFGQSCYGATILSAEGNSSPFLVGGSGNWMAVATWSLDRAFTDVSISAALGTLPDEQASATAFLTTAIGTGTTQQANEVARATVNLPGTLFSANPPLLALFSGLNLGPGTYFLTISSTTDPVLKGWKASGAPLSYGEGASGFGFAQTCCANVDSAYAPASQFTINYSASAVGLSVDGTAQTPEPTTWLLFTGGLSMALAVKRRHTKA